MTGVALTALAGGLFLWRFPRQGTVEGTRVDVSQPTVVRQIQQLERLETVAYRMEKIISGERESRYLPQFLVGERLLLIVHGEVVAGVDLSKVRPEHVVIRDRTIQLTMPKPEVFLTRIDNERTRVYSRETGLFSRVDSNLETQVRQAGERQLLEAALEDGILKEAEQNARVTMARLLEGFGFENPEIR
ncbi:MAG: DUF4230 domain-containing protein [Acidobacteria bacterium]|nr:DUF4230 domain-containing protein [Acidobacteriota bacterium]